MVVSLKANKKRILAFVILAVIVAGACFFLSRNKEEEPQAVPGGTNEERVSFLESFGWEVDPEPAETREVMIPEKFSDVYVTYNVMQKAQGFDLKPYAGATCTQYRYHITNYENEPEVYATLLVHAEEIIGGDVACAEVDGFMHGFAKDSAHYGETGKTSSKEKNGKAESNSKGESSAIEGEPESQQEQQPIQETADPAETESEAEPTMAEQEDAGIETDPAEETAAEYSEDDYPTD